MNYWNYWHKCVYGKLSRSEEIWVALAGIFIMWGILVLAFSLSLLSGDRELNWEFAVKLGSALGGMVILWPTMILGFRLQSLWLLFIAGLATFGFIFITESLLYG